MKPFTRETLLFLVLFLAGLFILPWCVYLVGNAMFGAYSGGGFATFYGSLNSELRDGDLAVWFLVLSPYVVWQLVRLTCRSFRRLGGSH